MGVVMISRKVKVEKVENGYIVTRLISIETIARQELDVKQIVFIDIEDMLTSLLHIFEPRNTWVVNEDHVEIVRG